MHNSLIPSKLVKLFESVSLSLLSTVKQITGIPRKSDVYQNPCDSNHTPSDSNSIPCNQETASKLNNDSSHPLQCEQIADVEELKFKHAPINWIPATVLITTPIAAAILTPWYLMTHDVSATVWWVFGAVGVWTGMSITTGYHRLLSHRAYKAHPIVRGFFMLGATLAVQGSAFDWVAGHRNHHRYVDDPMKDPYSAKRGFWFSHIGWMLKNYPSGNFDYKNIPDLTKDKMLQIQHKYYGLWVLATNIGLIAALGWLIGDVWATLILVGLLRLVINHHLTFFINSLCHMYGSRPYTDSNTARDNFILAIPTWGEGYHNYHHIFQYDYRNGVKWWQYDPTKWVIALLAKLGLAYDLRTVDDITIKNAEVEMQFKRANQKINTLAQDSNLAHINQAVHQFRERVNFEYDLFTETIKEWRALKAKAIDLKKSEFADRFNEVDKILKDQYRFIERKFSDHNKNLKIALRSIDNQLV